ncbi:hypothetical protein QGC_1500, partial [Clostridioides difficile CD196]
MIEDVQFGILVENKSKVFLNAIFLVQFKVSFSILH